MNHFLTGEEFFWKILSSEEAGILTEEIPALKRALGVRPIVLRDTVEGGGSSAVSEVRIVPVEQVGERSVPRIGKNRIL